MKIVSMDGNESKKMNFNKAYKLLKQGTKIRRVDWGFLPTCYIQLLDNNVFIANKEWSWEKEKFQIYEFSFADLESKMWEIYQKMFFN